MLAAGRRAGGRSVGSPCKRLDRTRSGGQLAAGIVFKKKAKNTPPTTMAGKVARKKRM
jgi:hypothetical protein